MTNAGSCHSCGTVVTLLYNSARMSASGRRRSVAVAALRSRERPARSDASVPAGASGPGIDSHVHIRPAPAGPMSVMAEDFASATRRLRRRGNTCIMPFASATAAALVASMRRDYVRQAEGEWPHDVSVQLVSHTPILPLRFSDRICRRCRMLATHRFRCFMYTLRRSWCDDAIARRVSRVARRERARRDGGPEVL